MSIIGLVDTDTGSQHPYEPGTTDNILINTNGKNMINQRDLWTASSSVYLADRWMLLDKGAGHPTLVTLTQETTGLRMTCTTKGIADQMGMFSIIENSTLYLGKTLTLSAKVKSNRAGASLWIHDSRSNQHTGSGDFEILQVTRTIDVLFHVFFLIHQNLADGDYMEFEWVKLEEGDTATPYVIPDPALELARCQRYFQAYSGASGSIPLSNSYNLNTTQARGVFHFVETMRTAPSMTISNASHFSIFHQNTNVAATNLAFNNIYKDAAYITATASGLTAGQGSMIAATSTDARIFLNAEL